MSITKLSFYQKSIFIAALCITANSSAMIPTGLYCKPYPNHKKNPLRIQKKKAEIESSMLLAVATADMPYLQSLLTKHKININTNSVMTGVTALHLAANNGDTETGKLLIRYGANVNTQDYEGKTPLHYAIDTQINIEFVELLLNNGANPTIKDKHNKTPDTYLHRTRGASPAEQKIPSNNAFILSAHAAILYMLLAKLQSTNT